MLGRLLLVTSLQPVSVSGALTRYDVGRSQRLRPGISGSAWSQPMTEPRMALARPRLVQQVRSLPRLAKVEPRGLPDRLERHDGRLLDAFDLPQLDWWRVKDAAQAAEAGEKRLGRQLHVAARDGEGEQQFDDLVVGEAGQTGTREPMSQPLPVAFLVRWGHAGHRSPSTWRQMGTSAPDWRPTTRRAVGPVRSRATLSRAAVPVRPAPRALAAVVRAAAPASAPSERWSAEPCASPAQPAGQAGTDGTRHAVRDETGGATSPPRTAT